MEIRQDTMRCGNFICASQAAPRWRRVIPPERGKIVLKAAELMERSQEDSGPAPHA